MAAPSGSRKKVQRKFKLRGFTLKVDALDETLAYLAHFPDAEDECLDLLIDDIDKQSRAFLSPWLFLEIPSSSFHSVLTPGFLKIVFLLHQQWNRPSWIGRQSVGLLASCSMRMPPSTPAPPAPAAASPSGWLMRSWSLGFVTIPSRTSSTSRHSQRSRRSWFPRSSLFVFFHNVAWFHWLYALLG